MTNALGLFKSLGFSESEATIYLHLLDKSDGKTLEEIITGCNISSSIVQKAIGQLFNYHALKVISNRFEALPPNQVFSKLIEDKKTESDIILNSIRKTSSFLIDSLEPRYWEKRLGIRPADILEPLESLKSMEKKTIDIINSAKTSIFIFAETFGWCNKVREMLVRALDRGVKINVLMLVLDNESEIRAKDLKRLGVEVRHCIEEWYPVRGTLSDIVDLVFLIWATKKRDVPRPIRYRPHYTTNIGLIKVFTDAFEKRWEEARPI